MADSSYTEVESGTEIIEVASSGGTVPLNIYLGNKRVSTGSVIGNREKKNNIIKSDTNDYTGNLIPDPSDVNLYRIQLNVPENTGDDTITVKYTIYQENNESKYTSFYIKQQSDYIDWYIKQTASRIDFFGNDDLDCSIELVGVNWYQVDSNGNYLDVSQLLDTTKQYTGVQPPDHMYCDVSVLFYPNQDSSAGSYETYDSSIELKQSGYDSSKGKWEYVNPTKQEGPPYLIFLNNFKTVGSGYYVVIIKGNTNPIFKEYPLLTAPVYKGYKYKGIIDLQLEASKINTVFFYFYENVVGDATEYTVCCNGTPTYSETDPPIPTTITPSSDTTRYNVFSTTGVSPGADITALSYVSGPRELTDISNSVTINGVYDVGNTKVLNHTLKNITCYIRDTTNKTYKKYMDLVLIATYKKNI